MKIFEMIDSQKKNIADMQPCNLGVRQQMFSLGFMKRLFFFCVFVCFAFFLNAEKIIFNENTKEIYVDKFPIDYTSYSKGFTYKMEEDVLKKAMLVVNDDNPIKYSMGKYGLSKNTAKSFVRFCEKIARNAEDGDIIIWHDERKEEVYKKYGISQADINRIDNMNEYEKYGVLAEGSAYKVGYEKYLADKQAKIDIAKADGQKFKVGDIVKVIAYGNSVVGVVDEVNMDDISPYKVKFKKDESTYLLEYFKAEELKITKDKAIEAEIEADNKKNGFK
jgi:hypothetical protein